MNLTIILVNFRCNKEKLQSCLDSIKINVEVLLIDHSHDFTFEGIKKPENLDIKIIKNTNLGNGAGINCGIKKSKTRYVLYLDIDTILPDNFFKILEFTANKINNFAIIAPKTNDIYNEKSLERRGNLNIYQYFYNKFFFKAKLEKKQDHNIIEQFFVSGSIMLIDKKIHMKRELSLMKIFFYILKKMIFFINVLKKIKKFF